MEIRLRNRQRNGCFRKCCMPTWGPERRAFIARLSPPFLSLSRPNNSAQDGSTEGLFPYLRDDLLSRPTKKVEGQGAKVFFHISSKIFITSWGRGTLPALVTYVWVHRANIEVSQRNSPWMCYAPPWEEMKDFHAWDRGRNEAGGGEFVLGSLPTWAST